MKTTLLKNGIKESKFSVILNKEANFVHFIAHGDNQTKDFLEMIKKLDDYSHYMSSATVLLDLRNTIAKYDLREQKEIIEPFKNVIKKYDTVKIADLVNESHETAYAIKFERSIKSISNLEFRVFSTLKAALFWLNRI